MFNKDVIRFMQSLFRLGQNRTSERKALLTGLLLARKGEFNEDSTLIVIVIYGSNRDNL